MKIFDSHLHLFSKMIIENVAVKEEMCAQLHLRTRRCGPIAGIWKVWKIP